MSCHWLIIRVVGVANLSSYRSILSLDLPLLLDTVCHSSINFKVDACWSGESDIIVYILGLA